MKKEKVGWGVGPLSKIHSSKITRARFKSKLKISTMTKSPWLNYNLQFRMPMASDADNKI